MSLISLENTITIALSVSDRHASVQWYQNMLGFELIRHIDEAGWSEMHTNTKGVTIGLGEHTKPVPGNCVPVFGVDDLDSARQKLEQADVEFDGETDVIEGMVKTATFYDPDGNALMLAEDLTEGADAVSAEPFQEVTVGVPVSSLAEAEAWYAKFLGSDTEVLRPVPGIVEFKVAPGVWLQVFDANEQQSSEPVVRFMVDDISLAQGARTAVGIDTGEATAVPDVVTFSEFADPFGNKLGFYDLP